MTAAIVVPDQALLDRAVQKFMGAKADATYLDAPPAPCTTPWAAASPPRAKRSTTGSCLTDRRRVFGRSPYWRF